MSFTAILVTERELGAMISCLVSFNIYAARFLLINLLTLAQCENGLCVNDLMLPLLMRLNPDQQTRVLSLGEPTLQIMPNQSGAIRRQIGVLFLFRGAARWEVFKAQVLIFIHFIPHLLVYPSRFCSWSFFCSPSTPAVDPSLPGNKACSFRPCVNKVGCGFWLLEIVEAAVSIHQPPGENLGSQKEQVYTERSADTRHT